MCGRFTLTSELKDLQEHFAVFNPLTYGTSYNIPPSRSIPAVRLSQTVRELFLCHWGLIPHWAKPENKYRAINARAETMADKPYFREAYRKRRCLIPANGFYEWKKDRNTTQAYYIYLPNRPLFAFAGLWENWEQQDRHIESCAIITTIANTSMQPIHDRMPVILDERDYDKWLTTGEAKLLTPFTGPMAYYPVSKSVNNPRNDSEDLIQRLN